MGYKRYKMLQKYINGEPQEEYRQGELIDDTVYSTLEDCNDGNQKPDEPIEGYIYQWVTVSGEYVCNDVNKYTKEKEQKSSNNGVTWTDTGRTRQGTLIEANSEDCGYVPPTEYRWVTVSGEYECVGYNKHTKEKKQQSTDGGVTWTDVVPTETRAGSVIEYNSEDCGYVPPTPGDYSTQYLTFEVVDEGTITFTKSRSEAQLDISYSTDNGSTWTEVSSSTSGRILGGTLNIGDKVLVKGTNSTYGFWNAYNKFGGTAKVNVYGNIMSLIYGDNFVNNNSLTKANTFIFLFNHYTNLLSAENLVLPATTLTNYCYQSMFRDCTSLVKAPQLPATTLGIRCYDGMFANCRSLTTAPALPATTLANYCYSDMFVQCTSLVNAPQLPATTLAENCYSSMFDVCTSLVTAPELPATELANYCYSDMFFGCTSLVNAPALPATTLAEYCYSRMFYNCTSLTTAPELPAETLVDYSYYEMFYGCSSLNYIKCLASIRPSTSHSDWVYGVANSGTFVKPASKNWGTGTSGIPSGWTVINI